MSGEVTCDDIPAVLAARLILSGDISAAAGPLKNAVDPAWLGNPAAWARRAADFERSGNTAAAGLLYLRTGNFKRAGELFKEAAASAPGGARPLFGLALLRFSERNFDGALEFLDKILAAEPRHHRALLLKSAVSARLGKAAETAGYLSQALLVMAHAYSKVGVFERSVRLARAAAALRPRGANILACAGNILNAAGMVGESIEVYKKAVALDPGDVSSRIYLSMALLGAGDYEHGWRDYEWRALSGYLKTLTPKDKKVWEGARAEGKNILVVCEQGYGDALHFSRYLPMVRERSGAGVTVLCRPPLTRLFEISWGGDIRAVSDFPKSSDIDFFHPVMSLPWLFGTTLKNIPPAPYLKPSAEDIGRWRPRVSALKGLKAGLCWAGNPENKKDKLRSMRFEHVKPLFNLKNISFVSLQKLCAPAPGEAVFDNFHDWSAELRDFADTAALVSCLDIVISVDTAVAHLSGALGQKTWTLIPFIPEWRWMRDTDQSPWYPSMTLIRQKTFNGWPEVISRAAEKLEALSV
jgi:tetratricopeptide (TPR) repeat protein